MINVLSGEAWRMENSQCGSGEVKAKNTVKGVVAGCFPQLYSALSTNMPDQVITL